MRIPVPFLLVALTTVVVNSDGGFPTQGITTYPSSDDPTMEFRRSSVRDAVYHAWSGYKKYAFGSDEVRPLSNQTVNDRFQGWGATMVDSLSTLWILDFKDDFEDCVQKIKTVNFSKSQYPVLFFETVIRYLGGLISGYDLSGNQILLDKAVELADALLPAFDSPSGYPYYKLDFRDRSKQSLGNQVILAEIGTVQLEFTRLSILTHNPKYKEKALNVYKNLNLLYKPKTGLYPVFLDVNSGKFSSNETSFGALGDSYYEYLLKLYIMLGTKEDRNLYLKMFEETMLGLKSLIRVGYNNYLYIGQIDSLGYYKQTMDHLTFFIPGLLTLSSKVTGRNDLLRLGLELLESCYHIYDSTTTGLGPEVIGFGKSIDVIARVPTNGLRPELLESLFYAYQATGDRKYQDWAWSIFQSLDKYSRTPTAFAGYKDVNDPNLHKNQIDGMESFFFAETMKYMYLIFTPKGYWDLDTWVFNTEAHPFKISK